VPGTMESLGGGSKEWADDSSIVFDQKHACSP